MPRRWKVVSEFRIGYYREDLGEKPTDVHYFAKHIGTRAGICGKTYAERAARHAWENHPDDTSLDGAIIVIVVGTGVYAKYNISMECELVFEADFCGIEDRRCDGKI